MSDQATPGQVVEDAPEADLDFVPSGPEGSLQDRIAERREALEKRTTELFDVPGFEGIFRVELRILGGKQQFNIVGGHKRVHDEYRKHIGAAADMILRATVGIHSVVDAEGNTRLADGFGWVDAARAGDKTLGPETKARPALMRLLGENGVLALFGEWQDWIKDRGAKFEEELARD